MEDRLRRRKRRRIVVNGETDRPEKKRSKKRNKNKDMKQLLSFSEI